MDGNHLIEASHLNRSFGEVHAVQDVSLRVAAGEIYGLVGPDGAGKTTTLRLLCGAYLPTVVPGRPPAQISLCGYDLLRQTEQARAMIGYLPQRFSLYEELTVMENIRFFAEVRGLSANEWQPRCMEILQFVGLAEFVDRRAGFLSGGMKQKLGLAAALVHRPRALLLDEPTTGVDPVTRQDFWQLIIRLVSRNHDQGTAVLVSTPYMDEAARCTRIGFMTGGRLALEGTPAALRSRLEGRVAELAGRPLASLRRLVEQTPGVSGVQMFGDRLHLRVGPGEMEAALERIRTAVSEDIHRDDGLTITRLRAVPPQLEDVFMDLLEANHAAA
jgi:ABC-2 type transport system ATP-binding protein